MPSICSCIYHRIVLTPQVQQAQRFELSDTLHPVFRSATWVRWQPFVLPSFHFWLDPTEYLRRGSVNRSFRKLLRGCQAEGERLGLKIRSRSCFLWGGEREGEHEKAIFVLPYLVLEQ